MTVSSGIERHRIPFIAIVPFLLMAFGLTWGLLALYILLPERMNVVFGKLTGHHPLFFLAVYAPAIAAIVIVAYHSGRSGLRRYFSRLLLWRCSPAWYVFLMLGIPLLFIGGAAIKGNLLAEPLPFSSFKALFMALILMAIKGPIEEFGWRGFALPVDPTQIRTDLGRADGGHYLGSVAFSSLPFERDAAKRLVIHTLFHWLRGGKCDHDTVVQCITWQHPAAGPVPFSAYQSDLA